MEKVAKLSELKGHDICFVVHNGVTDRIALSLKGLNEGDVSTVKLAVLEDLKRWLNEGKLYKK